MREEVLGGFEGEVDYQASEVGPWLTRLQAEVEAGQGSTGLLGALHGNFSALPDAFVDVGSLCIDMANVQPLFLELGRLGTEGQKYVPWMHATYLMAANRQEIEYLPEGADLNALTYDQFVDWMRALAEGTGGPKIGFSDGPEGLKHRFFQSYLVPAYAGSVVTEFRSDAAAQGWEKFAELWQYTTPVLTNYGSMQEPLLTDEIWVAWDHTARLAEAFNQRPDDFVAFPAPAGPAGRAYMPVLAGLAIPTAAPDQQASVDLINYVLRPETQVATLRPPTSSRCWKELSCRKACRLPSARQVPRSRPQSTRKMRCRRCFR